MKATIAYLFILGALSTSGPFAESRCPHGQHGSKRKVWVPGGCQRLEYPPIALGANVDGTVLVQITTDKDGHLVNVNPIQGSRVLTDAAVQNLKTCEFTESPDTNVLWSGDPIIVYVFQIEGICTNVTGHCPTELTYPAPGVIRIYTKAMPAMPGRTQ
jgi:hypothetical protein